MKVFASDFDNTLFLFKDGKGYFNPKDIEKIKEFQSKGNLFGLCTGRSLYDVFFDAKDILEFDFYILVSGAIILDKNQTPLHKATIPFPVIKDMYLYFKNKYNYNPLFVTDQRFSCVNCMVFEDVDTDIYEDIDHMSHREFAGVTYVLDNSEEAHQLCTELNQLYGQTIIGYQNATNVDIVCRGTSKGSGIEFIKKHLGVDTIFGIGDSFNDLPMLEKVDVSFTFNSSPKQVQQQATHLVNSIAEALSIII